MKKLLWFGTLFFISAATLPVQKEPPVYFQVSKQESLRFLQLIDYGDYERAWNEASPIFQELYPLKKWLRQMSKERNRLNLPIERKMLQQLEINNPKYFPKGKYMMYVYRTRFSDGIEIEELVSEIQDGSDWKVVMYYIEYFEPSP